MQSHENRRYDQESPLKLAKNMRLKNGMKKTGKNMSPEHSGDEKQGHVNPGQKL
jgi:hypothetical protein